MNRKSDEFRAQARRLEERAETAADENIRLILISVARRWRDLAQDVERYERAPAVSEQDQRNLKAAIAALSRAVSVFWDHEKSRPLSERLTELAAAADKACAAALTESQSPGLAEGSPETAEGIIQVKDETR
jgi:hypothetical protein